MRDAEMAIEQSPVSDLRVTPIGRFADRPDQASTPRRKTCASFDADRPARQPADTEMAWHDRKPGVAERMVGQLSRIMLPRSAYIAQANDVPTRRSARSR